ncbi:MAG: hypothetical protein ACHQD8_02510, partial [Chitinophagales bacterium]
AYRQAGLGVWGCFSFLAGCEGMDLLLNGKIVFEIFFRKPPFARPATLLKNFYPPLFSLPAGRQV